MWPEWEERTHVTDVARGGRGRWPQWGRGEHKSGAGPASTSSLEWKVSHPRLRTVPGQLGVRSVGACCLTVTLCGGSSVGNQPQGSEGHLGPEGKQQWEPLREKQHQAAPRRQEIMAGSRWQDRGRGRKPGGRTDSQVPGGSALGSASVWYFQPAGVPALASLVLRISPEQQPSHLHQSQNPGPGGCLWGPGLWQEMSPESLCSGSSLHPPLGLSFPLGRLAGGF